MPEIAFCSGCGYETSFSAPDRSWNEHLALTPRLLYLIAISFSDVVLIPIAVVIFIVTIIISIIIAAIVIVVCISITSLTISASIVVIIVAVLNVLKPSGCVIRMDRRRSQLQRPPTSKLPFVLASATPAGCA